MAKRIFELPGIHEIVDEQEDARVLPKEGRHLIIGGPGTGKSIVALLRCRRHARDNDNYVFLVFNHLLKRASKQLFDDMELICAQYQHWFKEIFKKITGRHPPADPNETQKINWDAVLKMVGNLEPAQEQDLPYLIIDEGQDMPPQFYQALYWLGFENFYVVADQNQQIRPGRNSSRQNIEQALEINCNDVIELKRNYRNRYPVARLAQEFYTGDPATPPPVLPEPGKTEIRPLLYEYAGDMGFTPIIRRILKIADTNPGKLIGIITPDNNVRKRYYDKLKSLEVSLDHDRPCIMTYRHGDNPGNLFFDQGGIMVINAQACKGLEFDTVFIADINEHKLWPQISDVKKKLFYVMVARARDRIVLLQEKISRECPVNKILPKDSSILERK